MISFAGPVGAGKGDYVVILHGIARSSASMEPLAEYLRGNGYVPVNIDYPSTQYSIEGLVSRVHEKMEGMKLDPNRTTHFVGYSLGGLIVRGLIHKFRPNHLGRVVLMGPPNGGSEVADFWKGIFLFEWIYGPAGKELGTHEDAYRGLLGEVDFELGVIAGDRSIDPLSSAIIPGPDDGKVGIGRTRIRGMKGHIVVHATHTFMMSNEEVMAQTLHFLNHGNFQKGTQ
jgi:pimeloyl-ACP methyl ester carboxylesterase